MLVAMVAAGKQWTAANPDAAPVFQWGYPKDFCLVADWRTAVATGVLQANVAGRSLLEAMREACVKGGGHEPTVNMLRVAIEFTREPPQVTP